MTELLIFFVAALAAVWARGKLDQAATALAVLLAWRGVDSFGRIGWGWDWGQARWYLVLAVGMALILSRVYADRIAWRGFKSPLDLVALGVWGIVQQGVLLGWLALAHPVLAVAIFALLHLPNMPLFLVTLVGGGASVWIAHSFGEPSILVAGLFHSGMSLYLRDVLGLEMGVGRSYDKRRVESIS